jgi:hypothetical protein
MQRQSFLDEFELFGFYHHMSLVDWSITGRRISTSNAGPMDDIGAVR